MLYVNIDNRSSNTTLIYRIDKWKLNIFFSTQRDSQPDEKKIINNGEQRRELASEKKNNNRNVKFLFR